MKKLLTILFILTVIITIQEPGVPIPCPPREPTVNKNIDGTYFRSDSPYSSNSIALLCYGSPSSWKEEWTDYPEKGGRFIKVMP